jgi:hypothetical protein
VGAASSSGGPGTAAGTTVATANILYTLGRDDARAALAEVLALEPDLVGLQEWRPSRTSLLRETGRVALVPGGVVAPGRRTGGSGPYVWSLGVLGGCAVGARADRFELLSARAVLLSAPGRADREDRFLGIEPPRLAAVGVYRDRSRDRTVALVGYHLVSGVQAHGRYRADRPRLVERHRSEVRRLGRLVARLLAAGHEVHAVGDSNFDGLRLPGLTSAWEGREDAPGTLGPVRHVDDVHGPGPARTVTLVDTASDHRAVVVRRGG